MGQLQYTVVLSTISLVLALTATSTSAHPRPRSHRFVAVPLEHVHLIREVRQAPPRYQHYSHRQAAPAAPSAYAFEEPEPHASSYEVDDHDQDGDSYAPRNRFERQSGGGGDDHEYVDYGAHTGHHGAFGWYADFPVLSKGHR